MGCSGLGDTLGKKVQPCKSCGEVVLLYSHGECSRCLYKKYGKPMKPMGGWVDEKPESGDRYMGTGVKEREKLLPIPGPESLIPEREPATVRVRVKRPKKFFEIPSPLRWVHESQLSDTVLCSLMPPVFYGVELPREMIVRLQNAGVTGGDVCCLLEMALDKELMRRGDGTLPEASQDVYQA